jgi:hypothetical protein
VDGASAPSPFSFLIFVDLVYNHKGKKMIDLPIDIDKGLCTVSIKEDTDLHEVYDKLGMFLICDDTVKYAVNNNYVETIDGQHVYSENLKTKICKNLRVVELDHSDYVKIMRYANPFEYRKSLTFEKILMVCFKSFRTVGFIYYTIEEDTGNVFFEVSKDWKHHSVKAGNIAQCYLGETILIKWERRVDSYGSYEKHLARKKLFDIFEYEKGVEEQTISVDFHHCQANVIVKKGISIIPSSPIMEYGRTRIYNKGSSEGFRHFMLLLENQVNEMNIVYYPREDDDVFDLLITDHKGQLRANENLLNENNTIEIGRTI